MHPQPSIPKGPLFPTEKQPSAPNLPQISTQEREAFCKWPHESIEMRGETWVARMDEQQRNIIALYKFDNAGINTWYSSVDNGDGPALFISVWNSSAPSGKKIKFDKVKGVMIFEKEHN